MRGRIGKAVAVAAAAVCIFWCVGCGASEDTPSPDIVSEEGDGAVSADEFLPSLSEEKTETAGLIDDTGSGEMPETVEDPVEESEDNNLIYYVSDDKVWENDLFCAFLEGEATAYDRHQEEDLTWPEYFRIYLEENYGHLYGMQLAEEDLDGDGAEELILMLGGKYLYDLYVFHEDAGRLYAWDIVEDFNLGGVPWKMREGGVFEYWGQGYRILWRFNEDGEQEDMWADSYHVNQFSGEDGKEYIRYEESLYLYEDGECVRDLGYVMLEPASEDPDEAELELVEGNEEELYEVYSALTAALSEEFQYFLPIEHADNAVEIPIWEVPGGQGWVSVEDLPENRREFEYVGE